MSTTGSFIYTSKSLLPLLSVNDPDTLVLEAVELSLGIGEIRSAIHWLQIRPLGETVKQLIIKEAEKMTDEAQNCFLKTLEEPPENTRIILQVSDPDLLLPTIVSRCQIVIGNDERIALTSEEKAIMGEILDKKRPIADMDRKNTLEWIQKALIFCHEDILRWGQQARALFTAQKYLKANTNVRLTIDNLLLKL